MLKFITTKFLELIPTFFGITLLTFLLIHMIPGDPIEIMAGEKVISDQERLQILANLGLDKPLWQQYLIYLKGIFVGDFGISIATKNPVLVEYMDLFPATAELTLMAMIFAVGIGVPLGIIAANYRGSYLDHGIMGVSLTGYSMPIFWWGLLMIFVFSVKLELTPVSGRVSDLFWIEPTTGFMLIDSYLSDESGAFKSAVLHLILPSIVLGTATMAIIARMTRSSMIEVLKEDYIRTAKAKGLSKRRVIVVHALRNALIPVVTVVGLQLGALLAGAILTETIFSWPGVGKWMIESISRRDYPAIQGGVLLSSLIIIGINLLIDVLYGIIDPRIRDRK